MTFWNKTLISFRNRTFTLRRILGREHTEIQVSGFLLINTHQENMIRLKYRNKCREDVLGFRSEVKKMQSNSEGRVKMGLQKEQVEKMSFQSLLLMVYLSNKYIKLYFRQFLRHGRNAVCFKGYLAKILTAMHPVKHWQRMKHQQLVLCEAANM